MGYKTVQFLACILNHSLHSHATALLLSPPQFTPCQNMSSTKSPTVLYNKPCSGSAEPLFCLSTSTRNSSAGTLNQHVRYTIGYYPGDSSYLVVQSPSNLLGPLSSDSDVTNANARQDLFKKVIDERISKFELLTTTEDNDISLLSGAKIAWAMHTALCGAIGGKETSVILEELDRSALLTDNDESPNRTGAFAHRGKMLSLTDGNGNTTVSIVPGLAFKNFTHKGPFDTRERRATREREIKVDLADLGDGEKKELRTLLATVDKEVRAHLGYHNQPSSSSTTSTEATAAKGGKQAGDQPRDGPEITELESEIAFAQTMRDVVIPLKRLEEAYDQAVGTALSGSKWQSKWVEWEPWCI